MSDRNRTKAVKPSGAVDGPPPRFVIAAVALGMIVGAMIAPSNEVTTPATYAAASK